MLKILWLCYFVDTV